jgi:hypothetical protein
MEIVMINALFGRVFLRCADLRQFDGYFTCVDSIRPLLKSPDFESSTPGFYINVSGDFNSVRLSYFTNEQGKTERVIQEFLDRNRHIIILKREDAHVRKTSEGYGGDEARFRNFLHTYTLSFGCVDTHVVIERVLMGDQTDRIEMACAYASGVSSGRGVTLKTLLGSGIASFLSILRSSGDASFRLKKR